MSNESYQRIQRYLAVLETLDSSEQAEHVAMLANVVADLYKSKDVAAPAPITNDATFLDDVINEAERILQ